MRAAGQGEAIGTLYVVGTPIGNLEDITRRALAVLGQVQCVAAEDTRLTRRLLSRHGLSTPLVRSDAHSGPRERAALIARLDGGDVAMVTDAGTPGISDPGARLVAEAVAAGHRVVPIPGPSAVATALSVAGFAADRYRFLGFLPRRSAARRAALTALSAGEDPLVIFEAPSRLTNCLQDLLAVLGDRPACVARELTKLHEEVWHGSLAAALDRWPAGAARGEFTLVVAGQPATEPVAWTDEAVRQALDALKSAGVGARDAARQLAPAAGQSARDVYRLWPHDG